MAHREQLLISRGYRRIVSEAQATQLLRRELKQLQQGQQRLGPAPGVNYDRLLSIKPGAWYRFIWPLYSRHACLLLCNPPDSVHDISGGSDNAM